MSTFAVTTEVIEKIWTHPNADSLELAKLEGMGFQFVIPRGQLSEGELILFFPVDSLVPDYILEYVGLTGKLSGPKKNRVKTIRLRGELSEGLLIPPRQLGLFPITKVGLDMTEKLGVTKYEPPENLSKNARTRTLPPEIKYYDIEGAQRWPDVVEALMDIPVLVTEKIEGSNYAAMLKRDGTFVVCTHGQQVEELEGCTHTWWEVTRKQDIQAKAQELLDNRPLADYVIIRGEVVGPKIQGNYYNLKDFRLYVFDVEFDGQPVDAAEYEELFFLFDAMLAPCESYGKTLREYLKFMHKETVQDASNGPTQLVVDLLIREGIVIRPMTEQTWPRLGRVILKQRSPDYLLKTGA